MCDECDGYVYPGSTARENSPFLNGWTLQDREVGTTEFIVPPIEALNISSKILWYKSSGGVGDEIYLL